MTPSPAPARLLWDSGGIWSLMTLEACQQAGLPIEPIGAADIAAGRLADASLLVVPGGWSTHKKRALGERGARAIARFVSRGGRYLGFCGGAGLALDVPDGLGLVHLGRASGGQRLPGLSGPVAVRPTRARPDHAFWQGHGQADPFHVWWPGQFEEPDDDDIQVLARYQGPGPGLCMADLDVEQTDPADWPALERDYGIALDPAELWGQAAVVRARLGKGRLLLSYLHLDTPGCPAGQAALRALWQHWFGSDALGEPDPAQPGQKPLSEYVHLADRAQSLWDLGLELGLWQPRHLAMPLWKRGVRGLEFWSLLRMCQAVESGAGNGPEGEKLLRGLERVLEPVFEYGPAVLRAQATRLAGERPEPAAAKIEASWFPRPRRVGGDLALALQALEMGLFMG